MHQPIDDKLISRRLAAKYSMHRSALRDGFPKVFSIRKELDNRLTELEKLERNNKLSGNEAKEFNLLSQANNDLTHFFGQLQYYRNGDSLGVGENAPVFSEQETKQKSSKIIGNLLPDEICQRLLKVLSAELEKNGDTLQGQKRIILSAPRRPKMHGFGVNYNTQNFQEILAKRLEELSGVKFAVDNSTMQLANVRRTRGDMSVPKFSKRYCFASAMPYEYKNDKILLVDDVCDSGGSLRDLASYHIENGADVIAAAAVVTPDRGSRLNISEETKKKIEEVQSSTGNWRQNESAANMKNALAAIAKIGLNLNDLTEQEASEILAAPKKIADELKGYVLTNSYRFPVAKMSTITLSK